MQGDVMLAPYLSSLPNVDIRPGKPPILRTQASDGLSVWATTNRNALRATVAEHGSLLVRGLELRTTTEIGDLFSTLSNGLMAEREAFAPRRAHFEGVYSATQWPAYWPMPMHHELSYMWGAPALMLFACLQAPVEGGATGVADSRSVLGALPEDVIRRFERQGWLLTRSYGHDIGGPIADAFSTENPRAVERYCRANAIDFEWQPDGGLRTRQRRNAVVSHPATGERCWFNQIAFFSEWSLDPDVREMFVNDYGSEGLPFNTYFGDGEPIDRDIIRTISHAYAVNTLREPWQAGDLMVVDNIRTAHSREPFTGQRNVLVAMTDPVTYR
jgi:alpha-ketoglutarate-dependent taurine dioxygenase